MDVTTQSFERDVLDRSRELPVVVDFWADWCGHCRMLGPAIESEVTKRTGKIELAKFDVDAEPQLSDHIALLRESVFGNPHSQNPTSAAMTKLVDQARAAVLDFFGASPEEYVAIFTPNATGALRLVGEAYPFRPGDRFLLTFDNHNSVNGIREFARAHGAETTYV